MLFLRSDICWRSVHITVRYSMPAQCSTLRCSTSYLTGLLLMGALGLFPLYCIKNNAVMNTFDLVDSLQDNFLEVGQKISGFIVLIDLLICVTKLTPWRTVPFCSPAAVCERALCLDNKLCSQILVLFGQFDGRKYINISLVVFLLLWVKLSIW